MKSLGNLIPSVGSRRLVCRMLERKLTRKTPHRLCLRLVTQPPPAVFPVQNITIADCGFGAPANTAQPYYLYNVQGLTLDNVTIGGTVYNTTLSA
jgi:hypothetical protein